MHWQPMTRQALGAPPSIGSLAGLPVQKGAWVYSSIDLQVLAAQAVSTFLPVLFRAFDGTARRLQGKCG